MVFKSVIFNRVLSLLVVCLLMIPLGAQDTLRQARQNRAQAVEALVSSVGDEPLQKFIEEHLSPEFRKAFSPQEHLEQLKTVRSRCANAGGILLEPLGETGFKITFVKENGISLELSVQLQPKPPHQIAGMDLQEGSTREEQIDPLDWDSLELRLEEEEKAGFSGTILVLRNGEFMLHKGYGLANRERGIANTEKTTFAIGSTPIDFTKAAILKLKDLGKLQISDPITKFLSNVPEDKRSITIEHLMTGKSGLRNFHHIPGEDEDYDLTQIDRETALRRILGQELLFPPGQAEEHSHSAWGLLAAIVEIVSQKFYIAFLKEHFFVSAGMDRTGLYEDAVRFPEDDVAVGYSPNKVGKINSPPYWGPTSWLVMGSGGMVSNPGDLHKWIQALRSGKLLSTESLKMYWSNGVLAGGNDRGFLCMYTEGPSTLMILCSNSHASMRDRASQLGRALARLVMSDKD
jgi:CubicO group peptidase (beta-lactamase class C family)